MKVGFLNALTLVFITLKLTDVIQWSWFLVLMPAIFSICLMFVVVFGAIWVASKEL